MQGVSDHIISTQDLYCKVHKAKAYLISPTNSLTFSKTEDCSAVKQCFTNCKGEFLLFKIKNSNNSNNDYRKTCNISLEIII